MTRALITGMSGFVGSHLAEHLLANTDWDIWGMTRWNDPTDNIAALIPLINADERLHLLYADLNDAWSARDAVRTARPDYVFHLAAQSYPLTSFTAPVDTIATNTIGTLNVLEAIRDHARTAWIHVCSSSEVYGRVAESMSVSTPPGGLAYYGPDAISEDQSLAAASPYSVSKIGADLLGQLYAAAYGLNVLVTRMFTHTGPRRGDVFAESSFAKQIAMIEAGQMAPPIRVGNLDSRRTIADVRDAARAYHMALTVDPRPGEVYNIGGAHVCTVGEILEALFHAAGRSYETMVDETRLRPLDADLQVADCSKFMAHTGWKPEVPFETTIADLLAYWRERVKQGVPLLR